MRFNLIGAGRLGLNLAHALIERGGAELRAVSNRSMESALDAVSQLQCGKAVLLCDLEPVDVTFITVPDVEIESVVQALLEASVLVPGSYVVHCSGVESSAILAPLYAASVFVASAHPLRPFRAASLSQDCLQDCYCGIEGDERVLTWLSPYLAQCGAQLFAISKEAKARYHAAAVFASNYPHVLAQAATQSFIKAGITADVAQAMTADLMFKAIENYRLAPSVKAALTGPLLRGDEMTLRRHLEALEGDEARLYRLLALQMLALIGHEEDVNARLLALLQSDASLL